MGKLSDIAYDHYRAYRCVSRRGAFLSVILSFVVGMLIGIGVAL